MTLRRLIDADELGHVRTYGIRANGPAQSRRSFELTLKDVEDFG